MHYQRKTDFFKFLVKCPKIVHAIRLYLRNNCAICEAESGCFLISENLPGMVKHRLVHSPQLQRFHDLSPTKSF